MRQAQHVGPITLTPAHCGALKHLVKQIHAFKSRALYGAPTTASWTKVFGAVDASGEGGLRWVGTAVQRCWPTRMPGAQGGDKWVGFSTYLELLAIAKAVEMAETLPGISSTAVQSGSAWFWQLTAKQPQQL